MLHYKREILLYAFLLMLFSHFQVTSYGQNDTLKRRPKIGLVLSGGGAKGVAHIGVLKVLEEVGIPIDYIAGTSMGSIVGGLYACGYSAKRIEYITKGTDWNKMLLDEISRRNISIIEKDDYGRYVGEFPIVKGRVTLPQALVDGQKVSMFLSHYTWPVHYITDFDKLPIPFRCIATDIENVKPVILKSGFLPDAIRASMAIPTFFSPIEMDGLLLVDGGIVRNFPVQDAREMGADIIIGVEVSASLYTKSQLNSAFRIMDQASSFQASISNAEQRKKCDILIRPDIENYNMFSFENIDTLIMLGEKAARKMMPELQALADSLKKYNLPTKRPSRPKELDSIYIKHIQVEGLNKVSKGLVMGNFELRDTGWITLNELEHGIERIYGTRFFERVNYKIDPYENGSILTIRLKEQPYNFFKFSLHYDQNLKSAILLNATYRNILGEGSRLLFDLKLGQYPAVNAQYTIHTFIHPNLGLGITTHFNSSLAKFYTPKEQLIANFNVYHYVAEIDMLSTISNAFMIRSGGQAEYYDVSQEIEVNDTVNYNMSTFSWYTRFRFDTQDRTVYPNKGDFFNGEIKSVFSSRYYTNPSWAKTYWRVIAIYNKVIPIAKRIVIIPALSGAFCFSKQIPFTYMNYLGGSIPYEFNIFPFDGLKFMAVSSDNLITSSVWLRVEPWKDKFLTLKTNFARTGSNLDNLFFDAKNYRSIGIAAGIKTIIGPVEFTLSKSSITNQLLGEIKIGYSF
jgi:NTE family protein